MIRIRNTVCLMVFFAYFLGHWNVVDPISFILNLDLVLLIILDSKCFKTRVFIFGWRSGSRLVYYSFSKDTYSAQLFSLFVLVVLNKSFFLHPDLKFINVSQVEYMMVLEVINVTILVYIYIFQIFIGRWGERGLRWERGHLRGRFGRLLLRLLYRWSGHS